MSPDISFPAAGHNGYYACYATGGGDCANNRFEYFYGTSAAAPAMAAITAILNQKSGTSHGNLNPLLYRTASTSATAFHDATPATSGVADCSTAMPSVCNNSTPGRFLLSGGVAGFSLATGYDQATGLGSLDVTNFLGAAAPVSSLAAGKLTLAASALTIANTQTVTFTATFSSTAQGVPSGTVQFYANTAAVGPAVPLVGSKATTAALPFPAAGNYDITAIYSGDTTFAQTTAPGVSLVVTGLASSPKIVFQPDVYGADPAAIFVGTSAIFSIVVTPASGTLVPTGMARIFSSGGGTAGYLATVPLINGSAYVPSIYFATAGSYMLTVYYLGDSVYSPSSSTPRPFTVKKVPTVAALSTTGGTIGVGGYQKFYVFLNSTISSTASSVTGTLQLYANGAALGSSFPIPAAQGNQTVTPAEVFAVAGTYPITAVYSGDANWQAATSNAVSQTVLATPASYSLSASTSTLSVIAGSTSADPVTVRVVPVNGFQGTVDLGCSVTSNSSAAAVRPPTCTISPSSVAVAIQTNIAPVAVSIITSAAHTQLHIQQALAGKFVAQTGLLCSLVFLFPRRRFRRTVSSSLLLSLLCIIVSACGPSNSVAPAPTVIPGTTAGTYTVSITATTTAAGAPVPAPVTIALTVN